MSESTKLADLIDGVMTGDPWHGSNVETILAGISPAQARQTPLAGGHSVWQLVLHMTGWAREVLARLQGAVAGEPAGGDWPAVPASDAAWDRDRQALFAAHAALTAALRRLPSEALDAPVVDHRDRAAGTGLSKYLTLHGLALHTVYHAGQIAQLRRALK